MPGHPTRTDNTVTERFTYYLAVSPVVGQTALTSIQIARDNGLAPSTGSRAGDFCEPGAP